MPGEAVRWGRRGGDGRMAARKTRTGDDRLEVTKEGRGIVMRVPLEGGGRLVVELTADEAARLGDALKSVVGGPWSQSQSGRPFGSAYSVRLIAASRPSPIGSSTGTSRSSARTWPA